MSRRKKYFIKQKLIGLAVAIAGLVSVFIDGDATFALFVIPFGLYMVFSRKMLVTDEYFFEVHKKNNRRS